MITRRPIPVSIEDFRRLREAGFEYVDKSNLITEFLDRISWTTILLPRPRRFGKSLNLTMLRWFFEKRDENLWHLFEDLHVARAGQKYRDHFQQYPVIHISFKEAKAESYDDCRYEMHRLIRDLYAEHWPSLMGKLQPWDDAECRAIVENTANDSLYRGSLKQLTRYLHEVHKKRPIVLIDEYDAPIHEAYLHGFYDEIMGFFRRFLSGALKDNQHLERGVLTGILRVSKESIFSELNNIGIFTLLDTEYRSCFGFTEEEVTGLLERAGRTDKLPEVRQYYNGYSFGGLDIYNPWSILKFLASDEKELKPHWLNTSSNGLVKELLQLHAFSAYKDIETLLEGGSIEKKVDENIAFPDLRQSANVVWNLLLFAGYLKAIKVPRINDDMPIMHRLSIPNREIEQVYRTTFTMWLQQGLLKQGGDVNRLLEALLQGKASVFQRQLQKFATMVPSYHDVGGADPEKFYHGLLIGLLVYLEPEYEVRSNRESGNGRPDLLIKPRMAGRPGVVLELKAADPDETTIDRALKDALGQMQKMDYAAELRVSGVQTIHQMAVAFDGKTVKVAVPKAPAKKVSKSKATKKTVKKTVKKTAS